MNFDRTYLTIGVLIGIIIGFIIAGLVFFYGISIIGDSLRVENMNITLAINETRMVEAINQSMNHD